jgi:8-oxo-dGTP pyrophosphatase MutT (NUDIX family)
VISETRPTDFHPKYEVVSCFCEHDGEILLLKRQSYKPQGNTWGVPAGKTEDGESPGEAILREVREECGIEREEDKLHFLKTIYVKYADVDFIYHIFHTSFEIRPPVKLQENEHVEYAWVSPHKALEMNLIEDLDDCIRLYYRPE